MKEHCDDIAGMTLELGRLVRKTMARKGASDESPILLHGLSFIGEEKDMTMTEFASAMNISRSTATVFVDRMAKKGLVARAASKENRRTVILRLTAKGKTAVRKHEKLKQAAFEKVFAVLSPSDRKNLARIFTLILASSPSSHD